MWNTWTKISKANMDHYNNHKTAHSVGTAAYAVVAVGAISALAKKIGTSGTPK